MPHEIDVLGVATKEVNVLMHPLDGERTVLEKCGKSDGRVQAIVGQNGDEPAGGESLGDEPVVGFFAVLPVASIEENHDIGAGGNRFGTIHVQFLAGQWTKREIPGFKVPAI